MEIYMNKTIMSARTLLQIRLPRANSLCKSTASQLRNSSVLTAVAEARNDDQGKRDWLQNSILPTYYFQNCLPKMAIPDLDKTCARYLAALEPLVKEGEMARARLAVEKFRTGEGKDLQKELVEIDRQNADSNYVYKYWCDMYLCSRDPLLLNFNAGMILYDFPEPEYNEQLIKATNLVIGALKFHRTLESEKLEPWGIPARPEPEYRRLLKYLPVQGEGTDHNTPLKTILPVDMSQYHHLYYSTRIPKKHRDELVKYKTCRHITVIRNGHIYTVDVLDLEGNIRPAADILGCLKYINEDPTSHSVPEHPLSVLTTENRDVWTDLRFRLVASGNGRALEAIDRSAMVLVLDDTSYEDMTPAIRNMLHGPGWSMWYDKPCNLVVTRNGTAGLSFEHAWGDGISMMYFMKETFRDAKDNPRAHPGMTPTAGLDVSNDITKLDFMLTGELKKGIKQAQKHFDAAVGKLHVQCIERDTLGSRMIKDHNYSPDSVVQLAYQLAFRRLYGHMPSTYESCTTSIFRKGRTETLRPATMAIFKACKLFDRSERPSVSEMQDAINECSKMHKKLALEASFAQGFDRHLFALKQLANEKHTDLEFFKDTLFLTMQTIVLSTSTIGTVPFLTYAAFGPVSPEGFGIAYHLLDRSLRMGVSSYDTRDLPGYVAALDQSLKDIACVLEGRDFK